MRDLKFTIQDEQYSFPYHHIPHLIDDHTPSLCRRMDWGLEYLCYQLHIREKVVAMNVNSVLEVGCGDGHFLGSLPSDIKLKAGIDLSERAVAFAKALHPHCKFMTTELHNLKERYDVIAAIEVLEHIPEADIGAFFKDVNERLNENGRFIVSVPTTVIPLNKKHYRHYTLELLSADLRASNTGMGIVEHEYVYSEPFWLKHLQRLQRNRFFHLEIKALMRVVWRIIWNRYRVADKKDGFHLVAVITGK